MKGWCNMDSVEIDRLWFKIKNMPGYDLRWEWMEEGGSDTEYIKREDVLNILEGCINGNAYKTKMSKMP